MGKHTGTPSAGLTVMVAGLSGKRGSGAKRSRRWRSSKTGISTKLHLGTSGPGISSRRRGLLRRKTRFSVSRSGVGFPSKKARRTLAQQVKRAKAEMERASELTSSIGTMVGLVATAVEVTSALRGQRGDGSEESPSDAEDEDLDLGGGEDFGEEEDDDDEREGFRRAG